MISLKVGRKYKTADPLMCQHVYIHTCSQMVQDLYSGTIFDEEDNCIGKGSWSVSGVPMTVQIYGQTVDEFLPWSLMAEVLEESEVNAPKATLQFAVGENAKVVCLHEEGWVNVGLLHVKECCKVCGRWRAECEQDYIDFTDDGFIC